MSIRIVQLGTPRKAREGLRIGTVRRPPRGVRKTEFSKLNYYDVWLPDLAPSAKLVSWALSEPFTPKRWARYEKAYLREMRAPAAQRLIALLARLSLNTNFSVGCYCADAAHCHRRILRQLLADSGAKLVESRKA